MLNLHFHHVDPSTKSFNMTMASGKSEAAYLAEARKCVLVCANCHGEIEAGLVPSPPAQDVLAGPVFVRQPRAHSVNGQLSLNLDQSLPTMGPPWQAARS
jgi:hypothetical protein